MSWHLRGTVLPDDEVRDIYVVDGRITFSPAEGARTLVNDAVLVPGLVDVHAHLALGSPAGDGASVEERVAASLDAHLAAGVLAVREPGGPDDTSTRFAGQPGRPRLATAGQFLAPAGRYFPGLAQDVTDETLVDAALVQLARGTGWVKVIGDSPLPGPSLTRTFSPAALAAAAAAVHARGGRIAVHCALTEVIQDAIDAGFDSIEHGTLTQTDQLDAMARGNVAWVPTRSIEPMVRAMLEPADATGEQLAALDRQSEVLCTAVERGVTVLAGTDAGMGRHGEVAREIELIAAAGIGNEQALAAGSWTARRFLGLPVIEEGAPADVVAYRDDPRESLEVLRRPEVVILDGELMRAPQ